MKKLLLFFFTILFSLFTTKAASLKATEKIDSLLAELKNYESKQIELKRKNYQKSDTIKANILNDVTKELFYIGDYDKAGYYANNALEISNNIDYNKGKGIAHLNIGLICMSKGDLSDALKNYFISLEIFKEFGNRKGMADSYLYMANIYIKKGKHKDALKNYFIALKKFEEILDKNGVATTYSNIGNVYYYQGNLKDALKNYLVSLNVFKELGDKSKIASSYNNIGNIYADEGDYAKALNYYSETLKIRNEIGDKNGIANIYNNIGSIYLEQGNYDKASIEILAGLKLCEEIKDIEGMVNAYINLGTINTKLHKFADAKNYLNTGLLLSKQIGVKDIIIGCYREFVQLDSATANWKDAYLHYKLYTIYLDSIVNEENIKILTKTQMQFEFDKKEAATKAAQDKKDITQLNIRNSLIGGLSALFILAIIVISGYRNKQKANKLLSDKNITIESQKEKVEQQNNEIRSSIEYAKRIQTAILPPNRVVKEYLKNSFILYLPKDIVAGDFYWMENIETKIYFAACDCTGHGVPGAMVSVVCNNALNRALIEFGERLPGKIFDKTRELVLENFSKSDEVVQDGMDASLAVLDVESRRLLWAGANNPLWIYNAANKIITETKADKQPIGKTYDSSPFTSHEFQLQESDIIYLFTDGYADQFGGEKTKKLTKAKFRELLLSLAHLDMEQQRIELFNFHEAYKNEQEQIDDICIIGVRV